jgi:uncharacterized protein (TIRG00374 family)
MRNFLFALIFFFGIVFIITRFAEVQSIVETLQKGDWRFLMLALGLEIVWLFCVAATFQKIFHAMGLEEKLKKLAVLVCAANFVNIIAPSAGVGGTAVFISELRQSGNSSGRITVASVIYILYDYAAFLCVLTLGFIVLFRRNNLTATDITAAMILIAIAGFLVTLLYLGTRSAKKLGSTLAWLSKLVNKILYPFLHKPYLQEHRAYEFAEEAAEGLVAMHKDRNYLLTPLLLTLFSKAILIFILFLTFMAFEVPYSLGTIIAAFSLGYLFIIVSPTPAGIGIVEGVLTLTLTSFYIPLGESAVVALAYRGVTFWFPLLLGFIAFRLLPSRQYASQ